MFLRFWFIWAFAGLAIATLLFWWAMQRGQFEDSRRAALLPFDDLKTQPDAPRAPRSRAGRLDFLVLMGVVAVALVFSLVTIVLALSD